MPSPMVSKSQFVFAIVYVVLGWYIHSVAGGVGADCWQMVQNVTNLAVFTQLIDLASVSET